MENLIDKKDRLSKEIIELNVKLSKENLSWKEKRKFRKKINNLIKELANTVCQLNEW